MKKIKVLLLTAVTALGLIGCGNTNKNAANLDLPKGGVTLDVTKKEDVQAVSANLKKAYAETYKNLDSLGFDLALEKTNFSYYMAGPMELIEIDGQTERNGSIEVNVKDLTASISGAVSGLAGPVKDIKASAGVKLGGTISAKGSIPWVKISGTEEKPVMEPVTKNVEYSLSLGNVSANAYVSDLALYLDVSNSGIQSLSNKIDTILKKVNTDFDLTKLGVTIPNIKEIIDGFMKTTGGKTKFDFSNSVKDKERVLLPALDSTTSASIDSVIDGLLASISVEGEAKLPGTYVFKSYSDGRFGLKVSFNKEEIKKLLLSFNDKASESVSLLSKLDTSFTFVFDANSRLSSLKAGLSLALDYTDEILINKEDNPFGKGVAVKIGLDTGVSASLSFDKEVKLPSDLSSYKELQ